MSPKTRSNGGRKKAAEEVIDISSREASPKRGSKSETVDFDIDFEPDIDSDLEAFMDELSQASSKAHNQARLDRPDKLAAAVPMSQPNPLLRTQHSCHSAVQSTAKRRALTDRPKLKTARAPAQHQPQLQPHHVGGVSAMTNIDSADSGADDRGELWWQRYEPRTLADLALHAQKLGQVRGWLEMAVDASVNGNKQGSGYFRILVLEGPAGACKSTCVRILARELGLGIIEWINPLAGRASAASQLDIDEEDVSVVRQFGHFLSQAERYSGLALQNTGEAKEAGIINHRQQIILVDDLPNVAHRDTRESFRDALQRFSAVPAQNSSPMVIAVTESVTSQQAFGDEVAGGMGRRFRETDRAANSDIAVWSAADVIPSAVYNSPYCQSIKFNPVAPTIVAKGLKRILQIRSGHCGQKPFKFSPATTAAIKTISDECQGDLRSAVTMLQLSMALYSDQTRSDSSRANGGTEKRKRGALKPVCFEGAVNASSASEPRRVSLDLFHALGKVLYAKRGLPNAPDDNSGLARGRLESQPDEVLDKAPVDLSTFGLYVHENYSDFCSSIEEVSESADCFSEADALSSAGRKSHGAAAGVADAYGSLLAVRGYMYYKAHPTLAVGAGATGSRTSGGGQQGRSSMAAFRKPQFFDAYKRRAALARVWDDPAAAEMLGLGGLLSVSANSQALVQDVLPFWIRIAAGRDMAWTQQRNPSVFRQLAELAAVGGHGNSSATQMNALHHYSAGFAHSLPPPPLPEEKLVLSDDDIEDFPD